MKTNILVLPVLPVSPVYNLPTFFLYHPDEILGLDNQVARRKLPSWSVAVQALVYYRSDPFCLLIHAVVFKLFEQPATRHDIPMGILRYVLLDLGQISSVII